uniref:Uncharacterized protein n=1 Tax=Chelonoidis abingdonii TaxID=106734 RepID=A0A8C0QQY9_CHEAB
MSERKKIVCQGATSITTFADLLCTKLTRALCCTTYDKTTIDIADEMRSNYPAFNGNRAKLETHILKSLVEEENFEKYKQYIHCLHVFCTSVHTTIDESTQAVKDKNGNASLWLDEFCNRLRGDLHFPRNELKKPFKSKPHEILFEQLCDCWEMCPFCKAVCTNTFSGHGGDHSVHFHHPQAVTGIQWHRTNHLIIDISSSLVASDCRLGLSGDNKIPYRNYRQADPVHAKWSITPDNSAQSNWKWFVCHFRSQIEKEYSGKFEGKGRIPPEWADFTKEAVLSDLEKL